ncbi:MAG: phosphatidate cytidylyltransferase [Duodenibacillus sp.]
MLLTRVITAAVLLLLFVGAAALGTTWLAAAMALCLGLVAYEWFSMIRSASRWAVAAGIVMTAGALMATFTVAVPKGGVFLTLELAATAVWMGLLGVCFAARHRGFAVSDSTSVTLAVIILPATFLAMLWLLRAGGWPLFLSVFLIVWLADVCAYFAGRFFGRHKMSTAISPKKTWEGAAGAFVSVLAAVLIAWNVLPHSNVFSSLLIERAGPVAGTLFLLLLTAVSIAGDLFESALKRHAGIKDSGRLLPGHGGFFDRLDAALAVFPCAAAALLVS